MSDGEFSNEVEQSQTSFSTQSFFEKNTQLIDTNTTQNLELHDAPTQEFTWSSVKSKPKLPPVPKAVFEEPVNISSNIEENGTTLKEDQINHSNIQENETSVTKEIVNNENSATTANVELVSQSHLEVDLVDNEVTIGEAHSNNITFYPEVEDNDLSDSVYSGIGVGCEENTEEAAVNGSDDDLTDCEEEPFKHVTAEESVDEPKSSKPVEEPERPSCPVFRDVADDDLTDCEEVTANSKKDLEADTTNKVAVVPSTSSVQQDVCGDDDLTDSEEDTANSKKEPEATNNASVPIVASTSSDQQDVENNDDGDLTDCEEKPNETTVPTASLFKSVQNDDDDLTDCDDDFKPHSSPSKPPDTVNEDSNDSVKFLLPNTSADVNENSDSEDSDSIIGVPNTNKKCGMVISTQDDPDKPSTADSEQINHSSDEVLSSRRSRKSFMVISTQDFNESSETQVYDMSTKDYTDCDISIPATQDVTGTDLDETDCIPATQDIQVTGNQRSQSTEESFKLGLTQMMTDDKEGRSQGSTVVNLKETVAENVEERHPNQESNVNEEADDSFLAPTQKFVIQTKQNYGETEFYDGPTQKNTELVEDKEDDDLFSAPTQKVSFSSVKESKKSHKETEFCDGPTQKNTEPVEDKEDDDLFYAPTQKVSFASVKESKKSYEETDFYDGPTQKITRLFADKEDDDLCSAPTQKISFASRNSEINDTDLFTAPTQKVVELSTQDSVLLAPTQKLLTETKKTQEEIEFYDGPTQIFTRSTVDKENDDLFYAPTQKINFPHRKSINNELNDTDLFMAPTQKVVEVSTQDDVCLAPPQKFSDIKDDDFYDVPTQKVDTEASERKYELDNICSAPTQLVDLGARSKLLTSPSIQEQEVETKNAGTKMEEGKKKVFTFKKVPCNLEKSLSEIIGITPVKSKTKDGGTSMILATENLKVKDVQNGENNFPPSEPKYSESNTSADKEMPIKEGNELKEQLTNQMESDASLSTSVEIVRKSSEPKVPEPVQTIPPEQDTTNNESSINVNTKMNQSIAILEAKFHKTRKAQTVSKIDLSVPKKRHSIELSSVVEDASEASVSVKPKRSRKATKTAETSLEPAKPNARRTNKAVKESSLEDSKPSSSRRQNQETIVAPSRRSKRKTSACLVDTNASAVDSAASRQNIEILDGIKEVEVKVNKGKKSKAESMGQSNKSKKTQAESSESLVESNAVKGNNTREETEQKVEETEPGTSKKTRKDSSKPSVEVTNSKPSRPKRKKIESVESEPDLVVEHLNSPKRQKIELNQTGLSTPQVRLLHEEAR